MNQSFAPKTRSNAERPKPRRRPVTSGDRYARKFGERPKKMPKGSAATRFLRELLPSGPWVLTAIIPDGTTETRTFNEARREEARAFIVAANEDGRNIYFSPPTLEGVSKKPSKKDIARTAYLHVDADPKPDETPKAFKQRALAQIKAFPLSPTFIVDSGNGLQLLWKLRIAIKLEDKGTIARVEQSNAALAKAMDAPSGTQNVDRLLRLPGTWNWPNKKKRESGRVKCWAKLIKTTDAAYRLADFEALVAEQEGRPQSTREVKREPSSGEIPPRWASLLHIKDPDSGGYPTRSELSQAFITGCMKEGMSEQSIISAVLDPGRAGCSIYEEARQKGGEKHVTRQIARARDKLRKPTPTEETRPLTCRRIDQFERRNIDWMWWPFIPNGMITMIYGDGEVGKSSIALDIAARITHGSAWPRFGPDKDEYAQKGSVLIFSKEDDVSRIVRPRLEAAGADISRAYTLGYEVADDAMEFDPIDGLDTTVADIEQKIVEIGDVRLVIIDPITDFIGAIDMYSDAQVRRLLNPIARLSARHNLAVIIILHLNKKTDQQARYRGMGSVAFRNVCKSTLLVAKTEAPDERVMAQEKRNLTGELRAVTFTIPNVPRGKYARIEWGNDWEIADVDDILTVKKEKKLERAKKELRKWLAHGPASVNELMEKAREEKISWRTMCTAKGQIGVKSFRDRNERIFYWRLPKEDGPPRERRFH